MLERCFLHENQIYCEVSHFLEFVVLVIFGYGNEALRLSVSGDDSVLSSFFFFNGCIWVIDIGFFYESSLSIYFAQLSGKNCKQCRLHKTTYNVFHRCLRLGKPIKYWANSVVCCSMVCILRENIFDSAVEKTNNNLRFFFISCVMNSFHSVLK